MSSTVSTSITPTELSDLVANWETARNNPSQMQNLLKDIPVFQMPVTAEMKEHWRTHEVIRAYWGLQNADSQDPADVTLTFLTGYEDFEHSQDSNFEVKLFQATYDSDLSNKQITDNHVPGSSLISGTAAKDMIQRWENTSNQWINDRLQHPELVDTTIPRVFDVPSIGFADFVGDEPKLYMRIGIELGSGEPMNLFIFNVPDLHISPLNAADFTTPKPPFRINDADSYSFLTS